MIQIKGFTMRTLWTVALLVISLSTQAQSLEDVIYKKDGSVLRGTLVEQDFENGRYKIQLQGGSLFSINKDDIEKITKEMPIASTTTPSNGININIENSPSISQTPSINQQPSMYIPIGSLEEKEKVKSVFFIGTMSKSWDDGYYGETYSGLNLAYQVNANKHLAIYTGLNTGKLSTYTIGGQEYEATSSDSDIKFRSFEIDALLTTNNYQGWQFYTGLGLFNETYSSAYGSNSYKGTNIVFGLGYSWKSLQAQLRVAINNSSDYYEDEANASSNLQLGFNFL